MFTNKNQYINNLKKNLSKRFTKEEITEGGKYKLAFLDVNIFQPENYDHLANYLKANNIIPVLYDVFIVELLQGLEKIEDEKRFEHLLSQYQKFIDLLLEYKAVFILVQDIILKMELLNCTNCNPKPAFNYLKIFSRFPLIKASLEDFSDRTTFYDCDENLNFSIVPIPQIIEANGNIKEYVNNTGKNIKDLKKVLYNHKKEASEATEKVKNYLLQSSCKGERKRKKKRILIDIQKEILSNSNVTNKFERFKLLETISLENRILFSPLDLLSEYVYKILELAPKSIEENDIIDNIYINHVSYCDIIICNDKGLVNRIFTLKNILKNNLKLEICTFNKNIETKHRDVHLIN